jgi:DNA mismatch repair protein MutS
LTVLDQSLPQLKNVHVEAALDEGKIVFLHKVMDGPTDESYGINVASLAELPINIIYRAKDILSKLEKNANYETNLLSKKNYQAPTYVEIMTPEEKRTLKMIKHADLENMKPLDALIYLASLKESLKQ